MNLPPTFPIPLDAFIAHQEQLIGRPLSEGERKVTAAWLDIVNRAEPGDIQAVDALMAQRPDGLNHFFTAVKAWMEAKVNEDQAGSGRQDI